MTVVRGIRDEDIDDAVAVLEEAFDGWLRPEPGTTPEQHHEHQLAHLRWYTHGPYSEEAPTAVATIDDRIVGVHFYNPQRYVLAGRRVRALLQGSKVVVPEFQRRGVNAKLREASNATAQTLEFVLRDVPEVRHPTRTWLPVANEPRVLFKLFDARRYAADRVSSRRSRVPAFPQALGLRAVHAARRLPEMLRRRPPKAVCEVVEVREFGQEFADLFEHAVPAFDFIGERSPAFLTWRFGGPERYTVLVAREGGRLLGYIALRTEGGTRGYVSDILTLPGRLDVAATLVEAGLHHLQASGVAGVQCVIPQVHPYRRVFQASGLLDSGRPEPFWFVTDFAEGAAVLEDPNARIHLMYADGH